MNHWTAKAAAVLLGFALLACGAYAAFDPAAKESRKEEHPMLEDGGRKPGKKPHHPMIGMEWLKQYPEEHQQWLSLMQERHLIQAELLGKRKRTVSLWAAAEERKDKQALEAAEKIMQGPLKEHLQKMRGKRKQLNEQFRAIMEQHDNLNRDQIRGAIGSMLKTAREMNELMKAKGKILDDINRALES